MTWNPIEEKREYHCATSEKGCDRLLDALRAQGLDIELVDQAQTGDDLLRIACIFDGPDADPHANRWQSYQETD
jgi:hypothetical protein